MQSIKVILTSQVDQEFKCFMWKLFALSKTVIKFMNYWFKNIYKSNNNKPILLILNSIHFLWHPIIEIYSLYSDRLENNKYFYNEFQLLYKRFNGFYCVYTCQYWSTI